MVLRGRLLCDRGESTDQEDGGVFNEFSNMPKGLDKTCRVEELHPLPRGKRLTYGSNKTIGRSKKPTGCAISVFRVRLAQSRRTFLSTTVGARAIV